MQEIRFKVNDHERKKAKNKDEWDLEIVERVEQIVCGTGTVMEKDSGYRWNLGETNDWKMDRDSQTGEFIVAYRYGMGPNLPNMEAVRATIIFVMGLEPFQQKAAA
ncbi:hypothetical protein ACFL2U_02330 [Patescibacteria group bacterium]